MMQYDYEPNYAAPRKRVPGDTHLCHPALDAGPVVYERRFESTADRSRITCGM